MRLLLLALLLTVLPLLSALLLLLPVLLSLSTLLSPSLLLSICLLSALLLSALAPPWLVLVLCHRFRSLESVFGVARVNRRHRFVRFRHAIRFYSSRPLATSRRVSGAVGRPS